MKIKRIEPIAVAFPMKKPVYMAGVEIRQADNILIRIEADNGAVGWGEAAEAPTMTGETVEGMFAAASYILPALLGRDAHRHQRLHGRHLRGQRAHGRHDARRHGDGGDQPRFWP